MAMTSAVANLFVTNEEWASSPGAFARFSHRNDEASPSPPLHFDNVLYPTQPAFATMKSSDAHLPDGHTISPLQTHFDSSNASISTDEYMCTTTFTTFGPWSDSVDQDQPEHGQRRRSSASQFSHVHAVGRRRKSENAEPGSARAIYLEKNRKAASKCRGKQKRQQEELVETARDIERRNKALKTEVEFLKGDMRELMELVGRHMDCPDGRLRTYVQQEADRLASGGGGSAVADILSSKDSSCGRASPDKG